MAENTTEDAAVTAVAATLEKIQPNPMECRVCMKELSAGTTALLPCCHGFHRACLVQQAEAHKGTPLRCGVCGTEAAGVKESTDVGKLPADLLAEAELAEEVHCTVCTEEGDDDVGRAVVHCVTCKKSLCDGHLTLHNKKKAFTGHVVEPLAVAAGAPMCPAHPGKSLDIYCATCMVVCCAHCVVTTHKAPDHETVILSDHAPELRSGLLGVQTTAVQRSSELIERLIGLHSTLSDVETRTLKLEEKVRRTIKLIIQRLMLREEELLNDLKAQSAEERATLEAEKEEDQRRWLTLEGALRTAQQLAATESNVDHLGRLAATVESHLKAVVRETVSAPPTAALIDFVISDDVNQFLSTIGRFVRRQAYGPECTYKGPGTTRAYVGTGGRFTVTAWTRSKDRVTVGGDHVSATLVSLADGHATEAVVVDSGNGTYIVSYAVRSSGEYRLDVVVNGRAVRGSPFAVTVVAARTLAYLGPPYYDNNGVIFYLATAGGTRLWTNPHAAGVVEVALSTNEGFDVSRFTANVVPTSTETCRTSNFANSWMSVSLNGNRVVPTGYVLSTDSHGVGGTHILRNWRLEGSVDGTTWTTLRLHTNDTSLSPTKPTSYWRLDGVRTAYSHFRILQSGPNSSNTDYLMATSFEIYGELLDL